MFNREWKKNCRAQRNWKIKKWLQVSENLHLQIFSTTREFKMHFYCCAAWKGILIRSGKFN